MGKRTVNGVVVSCKNDFARAGGMKLKPVGKKIPIHPITTKDYALAQFISSYYLTSLGVVLKNVAHKKVQPRTKHKELPTERKPLPLLGKMELLCEKDVYAILAKKGSCLLQTTFNPLALEWLVHLISTYRASSDGSIVVFVPERTLIPLYTHLMRTYFPSSDVITLSSSLTKGQFSQRLHKIARHTHHIIITTRSGLFVPLHHLSLVIVTESHDTAYKQWAKNPHYDLRTCAQQLAQIHHAAYLSISPSPDLSAREVALAQHQFVALPQTDLPRITIVDMKIAYNQANKTRRIKQRPLVSDELLHALQQTLRRHEQALLFINHQGKNAFSTCTKCKTVLRCTTCERALVERTDGTFSCLHCHFSTAIFPQCPSCGNLTFRSVGVGTESIEELIAKKYPRARIARVDSATMKKPRSYEKIFYDFYHGNIDILIGTQMATKGWDVPNLTLTAIIDMDQLLGGRDYDSDEKAYGHILQLGSRVGRRGRLFIQSFDTTHNVLVKAKDNDPETFAEEELAMRELLSYPPYATLIKLTCANSNPTILEQETSALYEELLTLCKEYAITISEPHDPLVNKVRTQYRKQLIITIIKDTITQKTTLPQKIYKRLITLSSHWDIDVDPTNLS